MSRTIHTSLAPAAIGPYSQAILAGDTIFTSGQLGLDPATGELKQGADLQTRQALTNLGEILKEAGFQYGDIVKTTVFVADLNDFATVNAAYQSFFEGDYPARSCVQVAALPKGGLVEIECIAVRRKETRV